MSTALHVLTGVAVLLALEGVAEWLLTRWSAAPRAWWTIASGVAAYALVGAVLGVVVLKSGGQHALVNALWQAGNICLVTLIGVVAFGNKLTRAEWVGVALAFAASLCFVFGGSL